MDTGAGGSRSREWQFLLACSPSCPAPNCEERLAPAGEVDPARLLAMAKREGVLGLMLDAAGPCFEGERWAPWAPKLQAWAAAAMLRADHLAQEGRRLAAWLDTLGLPGLFFKGPWFAAEYYGHAAARWSSDLDLLIREADGPRLHDALLNDGFVPRFVLDAGRWSAFTRFQSAMTFTHPQRRVQVDVHWRLYDPPWAWRHDPWAGARKRDEAGVRMLTFSPTDYAIYMAAHGLKHGWSQLIQVWDAAATLARLPESGWEVLVRTAATSRKRNALAATLRLVQRLAGLSLPAAARSILESSAPRRRAAARALARIEERGDALPLPPGEARRWDKTSGVRAIAVPLLDSVFDRATYYLGQAFHPSGLDIEAVRLPAWAAGFYRLVRAARLMRRQAGRLLSPRAAVRGDPAVRADHDEILGLVDAMSQRGATVNLPVRGASMFPFIRSGDIVRIEPRAGIPPRPGEVVLARLAGGRAVVHRVVRWDEKRQRALLRGDSCLRGDGWVSADAIRGRVSERIRRGKVQPLGTPGFGALCWMAAWPLSNLAAAFYRRFGWRVIARRQRPQNKVLAEA